MTVFWYVMLRTRSVPWRRYTCKKNGGMSGEEEKKREGKNERLLWKTTWRCSKKRFSLPRSRFFFRGIEYDRRWQFVTIFHQMGYKSQIINRRRDYIGSLIDNDDWVILSISTTKEALLGLNDSEVVIAAESLWSVWRIAWRAASTGSGVRSWLLWMRKVVRIAPNKLAYDDSAQYIRLRAETDIQMWGADQVRLAKGLQALCLLLLSPWDKAPRS